MTSAQSMRMSALLFAAMIAAGCNGPRLTNPLFLQAPYDRPQLWAVAPFLNESGVSDIDTARVADAFVEQLQDVDGIDALPVNRVIRAMRELDLDVIATPGDARQVMTMLDVDGLVVGTVTAYDPYRPMKLGLATELHLQQRPMRYAELDLRDLTRSPSGEPSPGQFGPKNPVAQAASVFDASNHRTLAKLQEYSTGRHVPDSAYGRDIYLVRMDLYTQFVCFRLIHDLLLAEHVRLTPQEDVEPRR